MGRQPPTGLDPGETGQLPTFMIENPHLTLPPKKNPAMKASQVPRFAQLTLHKLNPIAFGLKVTTGSTWLLQPTGYRLLARTILAVYSQNPSLEFSSSRFLGIN